MLFKPFDTYVAKDNGVVDPFGGSALISRPPVDWYVRTDGVGFYDQRFVEGGIYSLNDHLTQSRTVVLRTDVGGTDTVQLKLDDHVVADGPTHAGLMNLISLWHETSKLHMFRTATAGGYSNILTISPVAPSVDLYEKSVGGGGGLFYCGTESDLLKERQSYEDALVEMDKKLKPITDAWEESERLTAEDWNLTISGGD